MSVPDYVLKRQGSVTSKLEAVTHWVRISTPPVPDQSWALYLKNNLESARLDIDWEEEEEEIQLGLSIHPRFRDSILLESPFVITDLGAPMLFMNCPVVFR